MGKKPKKLLVLGLDAALPDLLKKFKKEGFIPNIAKLMDIGFFSNGRLIPSKASCMTYWLMEKLSFLCITKKFLKN